MAKIICFLIVCWIVIFGCVNAEIDVQKLFHVNPPNLSPTESQQPNFEIFDDDFKPFRDPKHDEFDFSLTKKVLFLNQEKNTVVSPFLVKLLLSMLAEAAGQNTITHRELLTVLPSISTENQTRELYARAFGSLLQESADYQLKLGAKLFVDDFIHPNQKYAAIIKAIYHSDVEALDFTKSEEAANTINAWCANATNNHITDIVTSGDVEKAIMLLINTIYFNGYWSKPFAENETIEQNFLVNSKTSMPVNFMTKTDDFYYSESADLEAQVLRLPYKGNKFAMYIILPYKHDGLNGLISKIDGIHRTQFLMEKVEVKVSLPKFKFTNTVKLNEILMTLGIRNMFTYQASFGQLVRGTAVQDRLQISSVLQKTGIEINEKGSTAYAATVVSLVNKFGATIEFNANRPFLFLIEDETTGTLIFSGKVVNPKDQ